ncbi:MAG: septum formation initiator family protein [Patescibacteria group bacterium]
MHSLFRSKLTTVALTAFMLWLAVLVVSAGIRRYSAASQLSALEARIEDAQKENARLASEVQRMQQPQWLALLARQRLNYKLPGETVVFVYKSEKAGTIVKPQASEGDARASWRKWLDWVRGK